MRAFVLTDKSLTRHAGRFVWLSLDAEKARNARARQKLGISALPTFFVVDPATESVALRWVGGFTVAGFPQLLEDGEAAVAGGAEQGAAFAALVRADKLYGEQQHAAAAKAYREALGLAPATWKPYPRVIESLLFALGDSGDPAEVVALADEAWPRLQGRSASATAAASGLDAALAAKADAPGRAETIDRFQRRCRDVLADSALGLSADDRSGLYFSLESALADAGDSLAARRLEEEHLAMLDAAAAAAASPEQRTVFDSHRLSLLIELGRPEQAVPFLERSARDFPTDYNPHARLASAYKAMKQWARALAASDEALKRVYGPRQFLVLQTRVDIQLGLGDKVAARRTLEDAIAKAEAMPEGQRSARTIDGLKKRLTTLPL